MRSISDAEGPTIVVVGAGAAGLSAAWTLAGHRRESNCRIIVLEASSSIGGRMRCEEIDGFHIHTGASVIHESFASTMELARKLGVDLFPSPRQKGGQGFADGRFWGMYVGGSLKQTLTTIRTMFFSPMNSLAGMWEFARLYGMLKKRANDIDFEDHSRLLDLDTEKSFADFARANKLASYLEKGGELDINCYTAGSSEEVGAAYGMALLWLWTLNSSAGSRLPKNGIGAVSKALTEATSRFVRVSTPVERVFLEDGVATRVVTASGETIEADAVICATTASTAVRIIPDLPREVSSALESVNYSTCCYVAIGLDVNILAEGSHAALFPPGSPTFLTMVTNLTNITPEAAPPGKTLVHAFIAGKNARELFGYSDSDIVRRVTTEMRRFFPAMPSDPLFARVYRWPEAFCLMPGGMLRKFHELNMRQHNGMRGLFLAGDYTRLPSLNGAVTSGIEAARKSLAYAASLNAGQAAEIVSAESRS